MMKNQTGYDPPGIKSKKRPHFGKLLLSKYGKRINYGFDDLERFELVDRLEKAGIEFLFLGNQTHHYRSP